MWFIVGLFLRIATHQCTELPSFLSTPLALPE